MSWIDIPDDCHFSLSNIPFGIISTGANPQHRPAVAIGNQVLDLKEFTIQGGFQSLVDFNDSSVFLKATLNEFASLGRSAHKAVRNYLRQVFTKDGPFEHVLEHNNELRSACLFQITEVANHLPLAIGDYTDFYVGKNHAFNCGVILRGKDNALNPNYFHIPVAYHGRASSIVVSGTNVRRPLGQILENPDVKQPILAASRRLDFEMEVGAFISTPSNLGSRVHVNDAEEYIFGYVLLDDWSGE
jgi:fumarylacetoacetase